jgi:hypothetical protein
MRRETAAFLDLVREAEDPTTFDEERVRRALRAAIAASAVPLAASGESPVAARDARSSGAGNTTWASSKLGALGSKLNVLAVCTAAALGTGDSSPDAPHGRRFRRGGDPGDSDRRNRGRSDAAERSASRARAE